MGKNKTAKGEKAGLLETNGALTPKFKAVIGEVFGRFDADGDGALSLPELEAFARASESGKELEKGELQQLGQFFDTDSKGNLTLKGFEQMYVMQTNQQAADTWRDIANLGYEKSLDLLGTKPAAADSMSELREAMMALKTDSESAAAHRRVGTALRTMGREDAAVRSFKQAETLEALEAAASAAPAESTVDDMD